MQKGTEMKIPVEDGDAVLGSDENKRFIVQIMSASGWCAVFADSRSGDKYEARISPLIGWALLGGGAVVPLVHARCGVSFATEFGSYAGVIAMLVGYGKGADALVEVWKEKQKHGKAEEESSEVDATDAKE